VPHPLILRGITHKEKERPHFDVGKIGDCWCCDFLPESYMASTAIRGHGCTLR